MNLKTINVIIAREYLTRVKKKSFLVTTILGPIFFAAMCILPSLIMFFAKDDSKSVAVVDESGIVMPYFVSSEDVTYVDMCSADVDSLKAGFDALGVDVLLHVSALNAEKTVSVEAYSPKPLSVDMKESIGRKVEEAVEDYRLDGYEIDNLKQIMEDVKADISVSTYTLGKSGEEKITSSEVYMIISLVLSLIVYMFIAMFSGMVMQSVIEEKSSRVVEVLVSSVKATELMFGKI
ncbi:MAG: ABC transporter permease, partial [Bacteroidales bacterium]|nr:ABC transporter permease [Bacteroidales bacterium]